MRSPLWLRPTAALAGLYVVLLAGVTFVLAPVWHDWDWAVFQHLSDLHAPAFSPSVTVLNLADYDEQIPSLDRQEIGNLLDHMAKRRQRPAAVLLDLFFTQPDCSSVTRKCPPDAATVALGKRLDAAADAQIRVYATKNPLDTQGGGAIDAAFLRKLDPNVYDHLGAGHTILQLVAANGLFYQRCYRIDHLDDAGNAAGTDDLWALTYRAVKAAAGERLGPCAESGATRTMEAVRLGAQPDFAGTVRDIKLNGPFPGDADVNGKYVIVATLQKDLGPLHRGDAPRTNPELLAWALSDLLERKDTDSGYFAPLPANEMLAALVAGFALVTLVAFVAAFQGLRRLRLQALRPALPWIAAAAAACFALALFGAFESWLFFTKQIQPQVSLVALAVVLAAFVCGERGREMLFEQSRAIDARPEESNDYDVFISYAHEEFDWVYEHVYVPFKDARTAGGRKLAIFFDTSSIKVGSAWQDKISLAIDGSRFVVPVYSATYFQRPYCRFEIKRAHRKWITEGENSRCVLPIMRGKPAILETVDDIQAASIDEHPDLVTEILAEITSRIDAAPPAVSAPAGTG